MLLVLTIVLLCAVILDYFLSSAVGVKDFPQVGRSCELQHSCRGLHCEAVLRSQGIQGDTRKDLGLSLALQVLLACIATAVMAKQLWVGKPEQKPEKN